MDSEPRQALRIGIGTTLASALFLGVGFLLLKLGHPRWEIFSYIAFLWGGPGLAFGLQQIYKTLTRR